MLKMLTKITSREAAEVQFVACFVWCFH